VAAHDYDLFVVGAGSAGVRAARVAADLGAKVALCEDRQLGGTCVNAGCVPKKLFVYGSHYASDFADAKAYGWRLGPPGFEWTTLRDNKDKEILRLNGVYGDVLATAGVTVIEGRGRLTDPETVRIGERRIRAKHILVATGGRPDVPTIPGIEHVITSDDAFHLERIPRRVIIAGGGYIGVEFAGIFHGLGAQVELVARTPEILIRFDVDIRATLHEELTRKGIGLHLERTIDRIDRKGDAYAATLSDGSVLLADTIMVAVGRKPNTRGLGLGDVGVDTSPRGAVVVDDAYRSTVSSIHAVGDVIDRVQLTPVALAEGAALARSLFDGGPVAVDYANIPTAVFTQPPVGTVGLTEQAANRMLTHVDVYRTHFRPMKHTMTGRHTRTMMKLVVDAASDRVVGCHMVGDDAGDIIQGLAIALKCGATKAQFDATIGLHPSAAEEFVTLRKPVRTFRS